MAKKKLEEPVTDSAPLPDPYPYQTPRWLHKQGVAPLQVYSPKECQRALDDGWVIHPDWFIS